MSRQLPVTTARHPASGAILNFCQSPLFFCAQRLDHFKSAIPAAPMPSAGWRSDFPLASLLLGCPPTASRRSARWPCCCAGIGLIGQRSSAGALTFYAASWMVALPGGSVLAVDYWFRLRMCFRGDAHAGVSCRLQVGAPSFPLASLPLGCPPSTTRRSQAAPRIACYQRLYSEVEVLFRGW